MRRLALGGIPCLQQHIYGGQRPDREQLAPRLIGRDLLDAQRVADHPADCGHLLELAQGLRPGQNIFRTGVSILAQRADRDCGNVALVDRSCSQDAASARHRRRESAAPTSSQHFAANIPGRRRVHWIPEFSINRSICSTTTLSGLGCWKSGCGVLSGAERKTIRFACLAIRSKAGATAAAGAVHTRNTVSIPSRHASRVSGRVRSPRTTSTCGGNRAALGLRASARTCATLSANRERT